MLKNGSVDGFCNWVELHTGVTKMKLPVVPSGDIQGFERRVRKPEVSLHTREPVLAATGHQG